MRNKFYLFATLIVVCCCACGIAPKPKPTTWHVTGDFVSVPAAVEAGKYDRKEMYASQPNYAPTLPSPVDIKVQLAERKQVSVTELISLCPNMVRLTEFLAFGAQFRDQPEEGSSIFTIWTDDIGQVWFAIIERKDSQRILTIDRLGPGFIGDCNCRPLVRV